MQFEQHFPGRLKIEQANDETVITVTARMRPALFIFFLAWFCAWSTAGVLMIQAIQSRLAEVGEAGFLLGFSVFWLLGWLYVGTALLWMLVGKEKLVISNAAIFRGVSMSFLKWNRHYDPNRVTTVRRNAELPASSERYGFAEPFDGFGRVGIKFGRKTINFGKRLDNSEADKVVTILKTSLNLEKAGHSYED
jgi:hypothetical protein